MLRFPIQHCRETGMHSRHSNSLKMGCEILCLSLRCYLRKVQVISNALAPLLTPLSSWTPQCQTAAQSFHQRLLKPSRLHFQQILHHWDHFALLNGLNGENTNPQNQTENMWCLLFVFMSATCRRPKQIASSAVCKCWEKAAQVAGELFNVYYWTWFEPFIYESWNGRGDTGVNCFQQRTRKKNLDLSVQMWAIIVIYLMQVKIKPHQGRPCWRGSLPVWVSPWVNLCFM